MSEYDAHIVEEDDNFLFIKIRRNLPNLKKDSVTLKIKKSFIQNVPEDYLVPIFYIK